MFWLDMSIESILVCCLIITTLTLIFFPSYPDWICQVKFPLSVNSLPHFEQIYFIFSCFECLCLVKLPYDVVLYLQRSQRFFIKWTDFLCVMTLPLSMNCLLRISHLCLIPSWIAFWFRFVVNSQSSHFSSLNCLCGSAALDSIKT